jgi:dTDP-4-amino-4,6-dideoxygalactose transaminase/dTDP-4-dehydrorhamnose 3,5-epimerase-like enzyme
MDNVKIIQFSKKSDNRGSLIPIESYKDVPFNIERIFYIKDMDNFARGFHSHNKTIQVISPISGYFDIELTDSFTTKSYHLNDDSQGLLIPLNIWLKMENFSSNCIIIVICSYEYDEKEYVRNYGDFIMQQRQKPVNIIKNFDISKQNSDPVLRGAIQKTITNVIDNCQFVLGSEVSTFEHRFASYIGTEYCVGLSNGTSAIISALKSLQLDKNAEVIVQSNSYIAAPLAIEACGFKIKVVDIDDTLNIDLNLLEKALTDKTKVVIIVHLYGTCPDMNKLLEMQKKYSFYLIEDAAQAHGSTFDNKKLGSFGNVGCFSFYPSKNLGSFGEAGCITTNDKNIYEYIKRYVNYGSVEKYNWEIKGTNDRLHNIQAAILNVKLEYLDKWNNQRVNLANIYEKELSEIKYITLLQNNPNLYRNYHIYIILANDRKNLQDFLNSNNIQTAIHYPETFYKSKAFKELNHLEFKADTIKHKLLSLPMYPELSEGSILYVCEKIKLFYSKV